MSDPLAPVDVYVRVQQFYARQMALLDDGLVEEWAATFCLDAVFAETRMPDPLRGRAAIRDAVRSGVDGLAAAGVDFRHRFGMLDVIPAPDGVRTRFCTLALATPPGGPTEIRGNVVGRDHLEPAGDSWLVRQRQLRYDGSGRPGPT